MSPSPLSLSLVAVLMFLLNLGTMAHVDITLSFVNLPQPGEQSIVLTDGVMGTTVYATTNLTGMLVKFTSLTDVLEEFTTGVSGIRATDASVNNITASLPGNTFTDFIANIYGVYEVHPEVDISVNANDGIFNFSFQGLTGNQDNYITLLASNGEWMNSVTIDGKFFALRDVNFSGIAPSVPEPSSLLLTAGGVVALLGRLRRHLG